MPAAIRWDRLSRYALLGVVAVLVLLYVNPVVHYFSTMRESSRRANDVTRLEQANRRLREQARALSSRSVLTAQARSMGMVVPGERAYVITGLPKGD